MAPNPQTRRSLIGPRPTKLSLPARRAGHRSLRSRVTESLGAAALAVALCGPSLAVAATPSPAPTINAERLNQKLKDASKANAVMPATRTPTDPQHTELLVEVNKKGQVTRVRAGKGGPDPLFNAMVYGNALQAYIRTPDGTAISGTYKLIYDYSPQTKIVKRNVELVSAGGVDANAVGAVDDMMKVNDERMKLDSKIWAQLQKNQKAFDAKATPKPAATSSR
jgi:hypothetical protein